MAAHLTVLVLVTGWLFIEPKWGSRIAAEEGHRALTNSNAANRLGLFFLTAAIAADPFRVLETHQHIVKVPPMIGCVRFRQSR